MTLSFDIQSANLSICFYRYDQLSPSLIYRLCFELRYGDRDSIPRAYAADKLSQFSFQTKLCGAKVVQVLSNQPSPFESFSYFHLIMYCEGGTGEPDHVMKTQDQSLADKYPDNHLS